MAQGKLKYGWLRRLWPRFSIGELFLLTFAVAVGLLQYRSSPQRWTLAVATTVAVWFAAAWIVETIQFVRRRSLPRLASAQRVSWCVASLWRLILAGVVTGSIVLANAWETARERGLNDFQDWLGADRRLPLTVVALCLVLALVSSEASGEMGRPFARRLRAALALLGAAALAVVAWASICLLTFHFHNAMLGIEAADPPSFHPPGVSWNIAARQQEFSRWAFLAAGVTLANACLTWQLARHWGRARRRLGWTAAMLCCGLAVAAAYCVWLIDAGVHRLSPAWNEGMRAAPPALVPPTIIVLLAATAAALRLVAPTDRSPFRTTRHAVPPGFSLFGWAPMLAAAIALQLRIVWIGVREIGLLDTVQYFASEPAELTGAVLALLGLRHAVRAWWRPADAWAIAPPPIRPGQFACVWLATIATAAPIATAAAFSLLLRFYDVPNWMMDASVGFRGAVEAYLP